MSTGDSGPTGFVEQWLAGARQSEDLDVEVVELIAAHLASGQLDEQKLLKGLNTLAAKAEEPDE